MKKYKTVVLAGGGSGGHITPLVGVATELRAKEPDIKFHYIGLLQDKLAKELLVDSGIVTSYSRILGGKFRRFAGFKGFRKLRLWRNYLYNLRDTGLIIIGLIQSFFILLFRRPNLVFSKGGYPAMPVLLVARLLRIPVITHDSDSLSGITHKLVSSYAKLRLYGVKPNHLTANQRFVGVPISTKFKNKITDSERKSVISKYKLANQDFILVTGGGLGARNLNYGAIELAEAITTVDIIVSTGAKFYQATADKLAEKPIGVQKRVKLVEFVNDMPDLMRSARVIIIRAGATSLAEASASAKPTIIVPNPLLPGGHQTHNAVAFKDSAIIVEDYGKSMDVAGLIEAVQLILSDSMLAKELSKNIQKQAVLDSVDQTVEAIRQQL